MTRNEFMTSLRAGLAGHVAAREVNRLCAYYDEMIMDLIEDGHSESDAVASMDSVGDLVYAATAAAPATPAKPAYGHKIALWALIILGAPLWGSLLLAVAALGFAAELCLWCIPLTGAALAGGLGIGGIVAVVVSPAAFIHAPFLALTQLGAGLGLLGVALLAGGVTYLLVKYIWRLHRFIFQWLALQFTHQKAVIA